LTILTPLRLLSSGLCAGAELLDEGVLTTTGMPRVYRVPADAPFFDVDPLYAFFVFANCDPGDYVLRWRLVTPGGVSLVSRVRSQLLHWEGHTNSAIVRIQGLISPGARGLRNGLYDLVFELGGQPLTSLSLIVELEEPVLDT
jgi:hypothetical protein